jgi:iron complex outermembrane recepter protein
LAGRYSEFSDFGSNFSSRIGLFWSLTDSFSLRGTYSESFKAPYLAQLNANDHSFQLVNPTLLYVEGNNASLKAETEPH